MKVHVLVINYADYDGERTHRWTEVEVFADEARATNRQDWCESPEANEVESTHLWLNEAVDERGY